MSEYELNITDRIQLLDTLPAEGDIVTLRIVRDLRTELSFSEKEIEKVNLRTAGQSVQWNPEVELIKAVEIGPKALVLISTSLEKLSTNGRLSLDKLSLYEQFVEGKAIPISRSAKIQSSDKEA